MTTARTRIRADGANPFKGLRNIGPAARADFTVLGITSIGQLAKADPDHLYLRLQAETGTRHDPCVWDVFAAAVHQARTGEARDWWSFTPERKRRQALGTFLGNPVPPSASRALTRSTAKEVGAARQTRP
jgi:hypothetical protein